MSLPQGVLTGLLNRLGSCMDPFWDLGWLKLEVLEQLIFGSLSEMSASQLHCFFSHLILFYPKSSQLNPLSFYFFILLLTCSHLVVGRGPVYESDLHQSACQLASNDGGGHAVCFCFFKKIIFGAYNVNFYFMEDLPRLIKILAVFFYFL